MKSYFVHVIYLNSLEWLINELRHSIKVNRELCIEIFGYVSFIVSGVGQREPWWYLVTWVLLFQASAKESRKRKMDYVEGLEKRVKMSTTENSQLKKKVDGLEKQNT